MEKQFEDIEIWDYVPFNHNYKVSSKGKVYSLRQNKFLKLAQDKDNYFIVGLRYNNRQKNYKVHRLVALTFYFVEDETLQIDHIDRDPTNNNLLNLRFCTGTENNRYQGIQRNNTSGYKGVGWNKNEKKWRARIYYNGKRKHLGNFDTKEEAYEAYKKASSELYGDFSYAP